MSKTVCFDVLGTCFTFDGAIAAIDARLGSKLSAHGVSAKALFFSWFFAVQRDFTYCSIAGAYTPIGSIFGATFKRAVQVLDVPADAVTDDDVQHVMAAVKSLAPRPGLKKLYDGLRENGWDVYAVTNGGRETTAAYYENADIELDAKHLLSCDDIKKAKPDVAVYETSTKHVTEQGGDPEKRWFVAAHSWVSHFFLPRYAATRRTWPKCGTVLDEWCKAKYRLSD